MSSTYNKSTYMNDSIANNNNKHRVFSFLFILVLLFTFNSCEEHKDPLKIGTNLWVGYEPLYFAREKSFLKENEYKLFEMQNASDVIRAFSNGMLDVACLTLDETYLLLQDGMDLKIVLIMDISHGADVLVSKPEIKTLGDLKGKTIAAENSAVGAYMLSRVLDFAQLEASDIQLLSMVENSHVNAYDEGKADAVVTFEPSASKLIAKGANLLFDSKMIPNEIFDVMVVKTETFNKRKKEFKELQEIWHKSVNYMSTNKEEAGDFCSLRLGLEKDQYFHALSGMKFPDAKENQEIMSKDFVAISERIEQTMLKEKLLFKKVNPTKLLIKE